jgi:hypothetical protein
MFAAEIRVGRVAHMRGYPQYPGPNHRTPMCCDGIVTSSK